VPIESILRRPQSWIADASHARHTHIPLPRDLFCPARRNSAGVEFGDRAAVEALLAEIRTAPPSVRATPLVDGIAVAGRERTLTSPIDGRSIGTVQEGDEATVSSALAAAVAAFPAWNEKPVADRAAALERAGDLIEKNRGLLIALLQAEGGKTLDDCVSRSGGLLPLLRRRSPPRVGAAIVAWSHRRKQ
jgi:RHH-type proline utilization regulon transcriptional repressor/proline dehydrogenase/delta 1-pyrroline-5-carboxylate dehydrogenase